MQNVQDSLSKIQMLLYKLPKNNGNKNKNYKIRDGKMFVNDSIIDSNSKQTYFTTLEKKEFIVLVYYLHKNFVSSVFFDENSMLWRFLYRESPQDTFNDLRYLSILEQKDVKLKLKTDTILAQKDKLYLLAPKDAKIR